MYRISNIIKHCVIGVQMAINLVEYFKTVLMSLVDDTE